MKSPVPWFIFVASLVPRVALAEPGVFVEPEVVVLQQIDGDAGGGSFGWAVAEVADVDGDGAMEAFTSAPFNTLGGDKAGKVYLYSGATGALLFEVTGEANDYLGFGIADAGDVDGDGTTDVIAGAPGKGPGRAFVYSGIDGSVLLTLMGEHMGGQFGGAVAGAGDLDGDDHADVIVGAPFDDMQAGRIYAFSGQDGALLWTRDGMTMTNLGGGTGILGDVSGDGVPDVVVGAPGMGGAVYVLSGMDGSDVYPALLPDAEAGNLGQFFVGGVGDVDGDGVPDVYGGDYADNAVATASGKAYVWSGASGERLHTFTGMKGGDGCGCGRRAGDADFDGIPDIAVGCYSATSEGVGQAGYIAVHSGSDGSLVRTIHGTTAMEQLGFDVVSLGDVDGDGRDDLLASGANADRIYILAGLKEEAGTTGDSTDTGDSTGTGDASAGDATSGVPGTTSAPTTGASGGDGTTSATTTTSTNASSTGDSSSSTGASAGGTGGDEPSGCACATGSAPGEAALLAAFAVLALRRRRT